MYSINQTQLNKKNRQYYKKAGKKLTKKRLSLKGEQKKGVLYKKFVTLFLINLKCACIIVYILFSSNEIMYNVHAVKC